MKEDNMKSTEVQNEMVKVMPLTDPPHWSSEYANILYLN